MNLTNAKACKTDKQQKLKSSLQRKILHELNDQEIEQIIPKIDRLAFEIIKEDSDLHGQIDRKEVVEELIKDLKGFGPINSLVLDEDVSELMVNGPNQVFCENKGKLVLSKIQFRDNEHVMNVIEKIVAPLGRRIDESSPMIDERLPNGSRVIAIIPPLALDGPTITIRKFSQDFFHINDLIRFGTLTEEVAIFLEACVKARLNIWVSGGTGSGKTTTLNALSNFIPDNERIVIFHELVRSSLRIKSDRIIIGEVRGVEAFDALKAMDTGNVCALTTVHSNSTSDMISRLETMVQLSSVILPIKSIREQIAGAIDVIVQQSRLKDGTRRIVNITEVRDLEGDMIALQEIFTFKKEGENSEGKIIGRLMPTGVKPKFYERLKKSGIQIPPAVFMAKKE